MTLTRTVQSIRRVTRFSMQQDLRTSLMGSSAVSHNNLGTLNGVFVPCLLNILGAPLFLFVGFSVGMMGWLGSLAIFVFCETLAYLTISSFSALVTNGRMRGGGAYFMISRSLGPAFGGSSGLLFWLTYCLNVTFNTRSFTDVVFQTFFEPQTSTFSNKLAFSSAVLFLLFLVAVKAREAHAHARTHARTHTHTHRERERDRDRDRD